MLSARCLRHTPKSFTKSGASTSTVLQTVRLNVVFFYHNCAFSIPRNEKIHVSKIKGGTDRETEFIQCTEYVIYFYENM